MNKMNWRINNRSRKSAIITGYTRSGLIRKSGNALIMIVLMFAMLLVLGTGAVTLASSTSRRAINETKKEQAYIAARSVSMAIKDQIVNTTVMSDRVALIDKLNESFNTGKAVAIKSPTSGTYTDINYELLPVVPMSGNYYKYTIRATYAGVSEDYSFVLSGYSLPSSSVTTAFMTANLISSMSGVNVIPPTDPNLKDIPTLASSRKDQGNNTVEIESHLVGDLYVVGDVTVKSGTILDGDLIVSGNLLIENDKKKRIKNNAVINGNIFISGQVEVKKDTNSKIQGSIYSNYYKKNQEHELNISLSPLNGENSYFYASSNDAVINYSSTEVKNINDSTSSEELAEYDSKIRQLNDLKDSIIDNDQYIPDWAEWPDSLPNNTVIYTDVDNEMVISSSGVIRSSTISHLNSTSSINQMNIIAENGSEIVLVIANTVTIEKPIRTQGNVKIYLQDNVNVTFENTAPLIPFDSSIDDPLQTYLIGRKNNTVTSSSSLYAFVCLGRPNGYGSGTLIINGGSYAGFDKFQGLMQAPDLNVDVTKWSNFKMVDPYGSLDNPGESSNAYRYAGIIR